MNFKNLLIHYLDNNPSGVKVCQLTDSIVEALVFPRELFNDAKTVSQEMTKQGIYFLIENKDGHDLPKMYAGQTRNGINRFYDHKKKKGFWNLAVLFVARGYNLGLDVINKLETLAIEAIAASARYEIDNVVKKDSQKRHKGINFSEQDIARFFSDVKFIMGSLGWPLDSVARSNNAKGEWQTKRRGIIGYMNIAGGNFEVLPGSKIDMGSEPRSNEKVKMLRQSLLQKGNIVHEANGEWVLQKIVPFNSPSGAAAFVLGGSQNGWVEWKNADGKTLQSVREKMQ